MRHRRPAQCRQVDAVQRADRDGGGAGGELSVLHHRAECRRGRGARSAARQARRDRQVRADHPDPARASSTSPAWCAARRKGEGLGNQFLANIREVDAIVHVLRCFEDGDITHVEGKIDPIADAETVETELMLADLESLEKRVASCARKGQGRRQGSEGRSSTSSNQRARSCCATASRRGWPSASPRRKRAVRAAAAADRQAGALCLQRRRSLGRRPATRCSRAGRGDARRRKAPASVVISAKIEAEIAQLSRDGARRSSSATLGLDEAGPRPPHPRRLRAARPASPTSPSARRRRAPGPSTRGTRAPAGRRRHPHRFREGLHPRRDHRLRRLRHARRRGRRPGRRQAAAGRQGLRRQGRRRDALPVQHLERHDFSSTHVIPLYRSVGP